MKALLGWLGLLAAFVFLRPSCDIEVRFSIPPKTEIPDGAIDQLEEEDNGWIEEEGESLGNHFSIVADSASAETLRPAKKTARGRRSRNVMSVTAPSCTSVVDWEQETGRKMLGGDR